MSEMGQQQTPLFQEVILTAPSVGSCIKPAAPSEGYCSGRKSPQCGPCLREASIRRPQPPHGELDPPLG